MDDPELHAAFKKSIANPDYQPPRSTVYFGGQVTTGGESSENEKRVRKELCDSLNTKSLAALTAEVPPPKPIPPAAPEKPGHVEKK